MVDHATPNLPASNFDATIGFYGRLGFEATYRDAGWLILARNTVVLEFFPYPDVDRATSSFGACLRLDDLEAFYALCLGAGIPETSVGWPRIHPPTETQSGLRVGALIDPDGTLLRLIQNPSYGRESQ